MVGALVKSTLKKIHIVVAYKCDADGEWIKFGGESIDQWSPLADFEIISLREES